MNNVFHIGDARNARDRGMSRAERKAHNRIWLADAEIIVDWYFKPGWEGLAEQFQPYVLAYLHEPDPYQLWGCLSNNLIRRRKFEHIERDPAVYLAGKKSHKQCTKRSSHACDGKIMRRL